VVGTAVVAATLASVLSTHTAATASCVAPTARLRPSRVTRGATLTITGQYFGDGCADTGTVAPGAGALGEPLTGLVIAIDQADREYIVATGSADDRYEFSVDVVVPAGLQPGQATVSVVAGDARMEVPTPLVISAAAPVGNRKETVATFGPSTTAETDAAVTEAPPPIPAEIPDLQPSTTVAVLETVPLGDQVTPNEAWRAYGLAVGGVAVLAIIGFIAWSRSRRWQ